jgi:hypothetical protein
MDQEEWKRLVDFVREQMGSRMYDDVQPHEVVTWLLSTWDLDRDRPSKEEVLRHLLEDVVARLKQQLPTWWQIHEAEITGKNAYDCERRETPRPTGAGIFFAGSLDDLRDHVIRKNAH